MKRNHFWTHFAVAGTILALSASALPLRAQDNDDLKRGVARLSLMNGDVNVRRGDSGEWVAGVINAPLMTDDRIATGASSRAEVQFDASNLLRLGANAEMHLAQLEYARYQIELARGLATFRILRQNDVNIEIDTPNVSVRPSRQGSVRIAVNEAGETEVTAREGDVEIFTPRGSQWIRAGQMMMARGSASDPEFQIVNAGGLDEWDRWCESRDRSLVQSTSTRYVGPGVYGTEDLDNNGAWESVPEYGYVWRPTVAADWAPYRYGRWSWMDWYGWTWVSYDPWGWAPYHYGRWFHHDRFGWCWYPGVVTARHYWSPALVGFIGFGGGGVGVGFGYGNVGWVPLAPYEVYHPWWGRNWYRSGGYVNRQVNITNVNVTNVYRNSRYNGVSAVNYNDFQNGRFNRVERFNGSQIREAGAIRGATPFAPGSQHLRYSDRAVTNAPRSSEGTRFFRSQALDPVERVSLRQQVGRVDNSFRGGSEGAMRMQNPGSQGGEQPSSWRRFGQTQPRSAAPVGGSQRVDRGGSRQESTGAPAQPQVNENAAPRQENRGGWQRFGSPASPSQPQRSAPSQVDRTPQQRRQVESAPRGQSESGMRFSGGQSRQENLRIAPPVVRERPSFSRPDSGPRQSAPSYSAPRQSAPSYSAPRQSTPSAPRGNGGGGAAPRGNPGGGSRQGGGGGGNHRGR